MPKRLGARSAALLLSAAMTTTGTAAAAPATSGGPGDVPDARARSTQGVVLSASAKQVTEGDRYALTAVIKTPSQAVKVTLEKWQPPVYYGDDAEWVTVKTTDAKPKVRFKRVATGLNTERYRAKTTYKNTRKPVVSRPVTVTVWRWIPLNEYAPYYTTGGTAFGTTTINGVAYNGWGALSYSHTGTWESRFTPGRHCKTFAAVLGVADISADGSSGTVTLTADDQQVYTSPTLTPGMSLPVTVDLPTKPYRFGIQLFDTTPGGTTGHDAVESWPVLGEPAFLCTGV